MAARPLNERRFLTSIFLLNVISLVPAFSMFWHVSRPIFTDDGPSVTLLLIVTAVSTLSALPLYSGAALLIIHPRRNLVSQWISYLLLFLVFACCAGACIWWAKLGMDGEMVFIGTAAVYAWFSIRLLQEIIWLFRAGVDSGAGR